MHSKMSRMQRMDNPFSREVVPSYRDLLAMILGVAECVLGSIIIIVGCAVFGIEAYSSVGGTALLAGISTVATGGFSIMSGKHKEMMVISATATMAFLSVVFSLSLIICSGYGVNKERERWAPHSRESREAVDIIAMILAIGDFFLTLGSLTVCCMAMFYGCFRRVTATRYVQRSNMPPNSREATRDSHAAPPTPPLEINTAPAHGSQPSIAVLQVP